MNLCKLAVTKPFVPEEIKSAANNPSHLKLVHPAKCAAASICARSLWWRCVSASDSDEWQCYLGRQLQSLGQIVWWSNIQPRGESLHEHLLIEQSQLLFSPVTNGLLEEAVKEEKNGIVNLTLGSFRKWLMVKRWMICTHTEPPTLPLYPPTPTWMQCLNLPKCNYYKETNSTTALESDVGAVGSDAALADLSGMWVQSGPHEKWHIHQRRFNKCFFFFLFFFGWYFTLLLYETSSFVVGSKVFTVHLKKLEPKNFYRWKRL